MWDAECGPGPLTFFRNRVLPSFDEAPHKETVKDGVDFPRLPTDEGITPRRLPGILGNRRELALVKIEKIDCLLGKGSGKTLSRQTST